MARVLSDLVRPMDPRTDRTGHAGRAATPTSIATFYDGGCRDCRTQVERFRRLSVRRLGRRADLLWRDIRTCPDALRCFGIDRTAARHHIHVVDRWGRMRAGLDARIALWRELPGYRAAAWFLALPVVHELAAFFFRRGFAGPHHCHHTGPGPKEGVT